MEEKEVKNEETPDVVTADGAAPEAEESAPAYEPKGIARVLDRFFRFKERRSTMKKEVIAGLSAFLISVCVLLVNTRLIGEQLAADGAGYAGTYLAATLVAFVGTMVIGFVSNLPLVQVSGLGMTSSVIAMLGAGNGLTYYNMLAVTFVGAIVYAVVMAVPASRKFVMDALPEPVRKALPVGMGLYLISYAVERSGMLDIVGVTSNAPSGAIGAVAIAAALVSAAAVVIYKKLRFAHPYLYGLLTGVLVYYVLGVIFAFNTVFSVNRGYIALGAENMYTIALGFSGLKFGEVFTSGFDFSAYTGNVVMLFVGGALTFFFMGMYGSEASVGATALEGAVSDEKSKGRALLVNAATNIVAPVLGSAPVSVGSQSAAAAGDGGRTGLTSVTCGVGYLVAMFTWLFFALLATYTATVSEYGHATSNSFAEYAMAGFALTDGVMFALGLFMMKGIRDLKSGHIDELVPFVATAAIFAVTRNIVMAVTAGVVAYVILKLLSFKVDTIKGIGIPTAVLAVVLLFASIAM